LLTLNVTCLCADFHAEEVYNAVRIMITCYVWMTGFGNFSFFYVKQDFGWLRVVQMMWRLNFAVMFLMWTHGNTYILYYICPLHTFYFMMVYTTMYCFSHLNHSKYGIRAKLMILGIIIFVVWDLNSNIFDAIFGWVLGTDKIIGAGRGSLWEYYFRTSLDHYSSFLGMIFALNFPLAEQYFYKAKGYSLAVTGVLMAAITFYWYSNYYVLSKLDYNMHHSYWAIVPLISYIFFRNITPQIRSGISMSMHVLGKTTLETYLLQHHIWLTSNAKTLLTIVPGHPYVNFICATILFYVVSKELYSLTMSLRYACLWFDLLCCVRNRVQCLLLSVIRCYFA
jgi:N-acetylneuraminate 9-O-acetyltransferase